MSERAALVLIANQLREIYHTLSNDILSAKSHRPVWSIETVSTPTGQEQVVVKLSPLRSLYERLERLAEEELIIAEASLRNGKERTS